MPLFWRNFLAFWLVMASLVVLGIMLTATVAWYRINSLENVSPGLLAREARQIAREKGMEGLRGWANEIEARHGALRVFIVKPDNTDILGHALPPQLRDWLLTLREAQKEDAYFGIESSVPEIEAAPSWWRPQAIALADREPLLMLFLPFDASQWEVLGVSYVPLILFLFALALSLPLCWALARHVTKPVHLLRLAARQLAAGRLTTRTPVALSERRDELGQLASDFDMMATRIEDLVGEHGRLLRNVAHELRTPLARLRLSVALARRDDGMLEQQLDRIEKEVQRLDSLMTHTLQLAAASNTTEVGERIDLSGIIDQIVGDARLEATARDIRIVWAAPGIVFMSGLEHQIRSAIENVLRNAVRHSPRASSIRVALATSARQALISIADEGPGVPEACLKTIFEPFYRVRESQGPAMGAGLGLSIAQACVAAHGGTISAHNLCPQGHLCVTIALPLASSGIAPTDRHRILQQPV